MFVRVSAIHGILNHSLSPFISGTVRDYGEHTKIVCTVALVITNCWLFTGVTLAGTNNAAVPKMEANASESTNMMRSYLARGVIRELPTDGQTVVVRHEEIPGFMPRMTMEFSVRETNELRGLVVGDAIMFYVKANEQASWIEGIKRASTNNFTARPPSDTPSSSALEIAHLKPGDVLSDPVFLAEDGRTIKLSDFEGSAVAFTFIFTRCPLPDFCPRMNQHFSRARELLLRLAEGPTNWQFLSVSFDIEFDKSEVLKRYAYGYRGENTDRWLFAVAGTNVMASLSAQLDFRFVNEGSSFVHNLRTVVIDPGRRVYRQFKGSNWNPGELAQAVAEAAQSGHKPAP